jgi:hypothetical protein
MRTTISLDPRLAQLAKRAAKTQRRNFSNLVEVALAAYITPAARPTAEAEAATELRALGACPVMALRDKIAEVQRDTLLAQHSGN